MTIQNSDLPRIKEDLDGVETRRRQFTETEKKLNDYTASVDEAVEWYYSQDPLKEQRMLDLLISQKEQSYDRLFKSDLEALARSCLYDRAAVILMGNLLYPEIIGGEKVEKSELQEIVGTENDVSNFPQLIDELENVQLDRRGITQLALAGDMLIEASNFVAYSGLCVERSSVKDSNAILETGLPYVKHNPGLNDLYFQAGNLAYMMATTKAIESVVYSDGFGLGHNPKMTELSMKMAVRTAAIRYNTEQDQNEALKKTINPLLTVFVDVLQNGELDGLDASVLKGDWHEFIWFVDFCMYCQINGQKGSITPSSAFEDCPHSNYPRYNRGFDYRVRTTHAERAVQLKSSPKAAKKSVSHPLIITAVETEFLTESAELIDKFEYYRRYIDSNFDPKLRQEIESRILPTAKTVFDQISRQESIENRSTLHHIDQIHSIGSELPFYNRAMRRAIERRRK